MSGAGAPLIDLGRSLPDGWRWLRPAAPLLERALGLRRINAMHRELAGHGLEGGAYAALGLSRLGVSVELADADVERLRAVQGPCLVLANHPLGGRDALALITLLARARGDFKVLANSILGAIPELRQRLILVDPFGGHLAMAANRAPVREARDWLARGGLLGLFPAGEVSYWRADESRSADKDWSGQCVRLARWTDATVLPLHISGSISPWLGALARLRPAWKTPFLARELLDGPARRLRLRLGEPLRARDLPHAADPAAAARWLRRRCYALAAETGVARGEAGPAVPAFPSIG